MIRIEGRDEASEKLETAVRLLQARLLQQYEYALFDQRLESVCPHGPLAAPLPWERLSFTIEVGDYTSEVNPESLMGVGFEHEPFEPTVRIATQEKPHADR